MTNQRPSLPWKFMTHGFLDPSAFPETNGIIQMNLRVGRIESVAIELAVSGRLVCDCVREDAVF